MMLDTCCNICRSYSHITALCPFKTRPRNDMMVLFCVDCERLILAPKALVDTHRSGHAKSGVAS